MGKIKDFCLLALVLLICGHKVMLAEAISIGDNCVTNGALAGDPNDETQYFYCMGGKIYVGMCTDGTAFNSITFQCVPGGIVLPGGTNCFNNDHATYPFATDNSKYYYCLGGRPLVVQCPANTFYNGISRTCSSRGGQGATGCQAGVDTMYATGCQTYAICINGVSYPQTCPSGQYYQQATTSCGSTIPAGCNGSTNGGSTTTCGSSEAGKLQAVSGNCQQYQICINGNWVTQSCQIGYYFSREKLNCGPAATTTCTGTSNVGVNPNYPFYPIFPNNPINRDIPNYIVYPIVDNYPGQYPGTGFCRINQNTISADVNNCRNYISCINGIRYIRTCPNGLYFDPLTASCSVGVSTTCLSQNIGLGTEVTCPANSEITLADPNNCQKYVACSNGLGISFTCGPGLFYNIELNTCSMIVPERCTLISVIF